VEDGSGGRPALITGEETLTYRQVQEAVDRVGNGLRELGVRMEERVMILLPDGPQFAAVFFGAMKIGAVAVPVNTLLTPEDYRFLLADSRAAALVVAAELFPKVERIRTGLRHLRHTLVVGGGPPPAGAIDFLEWSAAAHDRLDPEDTSKDDPAFWLYTSGTTGAPKGAVHLHHDMIVAADLYARPVLGLEPGDLCFSAAKLFFAYGLGNGLYFPFRVGAAAVHLPGKPTPEAVLSIISRFEPTIFFSVPTGFAALLAHAEAKGIVSLGRVRLAVSAGEPLPAAIFERWLGRFGMEVLDGIGTTEILHIFISNRSGEARAGSTGKIVPGYQARIVDGGGRDLPAGEVGELLIRGDSTASTYWNRHEETRRTMLGEWIRTGDRFHLDGEGYYWFHGRSDDMLKVSGYWVSPAEVEAALMAHPGILECAVVGKEDPEGLVKPLALVVLRPGAEPSREIEEEIQALLRGRIASYKCPRWISFVRELPKTATGKVQRFKLRDRSRTAGWR
jgi:benzoate-CoA ligase family protein